MNVKSPLYRCFGTLGVGAIVWSSIALRTIAQSTIVAEPSEVRFSRYEDSATIVVKRGDEALPSNAVKSVRAVIGKSDYSHQFNIKKSASGPATITLSPKEGEAQSGTFTLVIATKNGNAHVAIDMPLDQIPGTLEDRARAEGITLDEMKAKLGLSHEGKREEVTVHLPQWQYVGSAFTLRLPATPGRDYTWKMDGKVVAEGKDQNFMKCVLESAGEHKIELLVRAGDSIVTQWSGILTVIDYPDMRWQVRKGQPLALRAPKGFKSHSWTIDGRGAGSGETLKHTFKETGEHTIECLSREPIVGEAGEFRKQTWNTTVK